LFPDHLAHVRLGHTHLDARGRVALNLTHVNRFRIIDEALTIISTVSRIMLSTAA